MRFTKKTLLLGLVVAAVAACQDDGRTITAPTVPASRQGDIAPTPGPLVRITSPRSDDVVARGLGAPGAGSLTAGTGFSIVIETVSGDAPVPANESTNIRNTALLGQPNPNFPGLSVVIDHDLVAPDGTIIPARTNLANLFNTLGSDDSPGRGVTTWVGWHVLESFRAGVQHVTITASVRDAAGRVSTNSVVVGIGHEGTSGQALTPAPTAVHGDGVDDLDGPEVSLVGPREHSTIALGTNTGPAFTFFQVSALDRTGAGIGVNENGDGITTPVGLIRDGGQFALTGNNRNFPGLSFTFDVDFRRANGVIVKAGQNLAPAFDIAGSVVDHLSGGHIRTTAAWVAGGNFILPDGKTDIAVTARVTDNAGKSGSVTRKFGVSTVPEGQLLTPQP